MKLFYIILTILLIKINAFAVIPAEQTTLDINTVAPVAPIEEITTQDIAKFIPTNMEPTDSESKVGTKIVKQFTKSILKSDMVKQSSLGQTAETIKSGASTEIGTNKSAESNEVNHKLKFQLDPLKTQAKLKYSGYFNAQSIYEMDEDGLRVEITERLFKQYDLVVSHKVNEELSSVLVRWNWDPQ